MPTRWEPPFSCLLLLLLCGNFRKKEQEKKSDALINKIYTRTTLPSKPPQSFGQKVRERAKGLARKPKSQLPPIHNKMSVCVFVFIISTRTYASNARYLIQAINLGPLDDAECNSLRDSDGLVAAAAAAAAAVAAVWCGLITPPKGPLHT